MQGIAMTRARAAALGLLTAILVSGCGGGGGNPGSCISGSLQECAGSSSGSSSTPATASNPVPLAGTSAQVANICTAEGKMLFTRTYLEEVYLWYREIRDIDASTYTSLGTYFYDLLTKALDPNGQLKDRFSFIVTSADADSITTGASVSYGIWWEEDAQGRQRVAFIDAGSPAQAAGMARGGELVQVLTPGSPDWYPNSGAQITFTFRDSPAAELRTITLNAASLQEDPLPLAGNVTTAAGKPVAYLLFNAHTRGAQDKLVTALNSVRQSGARELVLDMRYNGGGFLYTALGLSSMIAGPDADGRVFERLQFNDKRQAETDESVINFSGSLQVGEVQYPVGTKLERLALPRVYVLATGSTCSASESVINSLRGIGVEVVVVGQATCGKPYGFSRKDNCGVSYFPIEFQGVNDKGFGDYAAGFAPTCVVADDFDHALGNPSERLLATALRHIDQGNCGATGQVQVRRMSQPDVFGGPSQRRPGKLVLTPRP